MKGLKEILKELGGDEFFELLLEHGFDERSLVYTTKRHLEDIVPKNLFGKLCAFEFRLEKWQENKLKHFGESSEASTSKSVLPSESYPENQQRSEPISQQSESLALSTPPSSPLLVPTSPTSTPTSEIPPLNTSSSTSSQSEFNSILKRSLVGRSILRDFKITKEISPKQRQLISNIVTIYLFNNEIKPSPKTFEKFTPEIVTCFPSEVPEIYFIYAKGQKSRRCLYYKYHNAVANLRRDGVLQRKAKKNNVNAVAQNASFISDEHCEADQNWLKYNIEPYDVVIKKWTSTYKKGLFDLRSDKDLNSLLDDWPLYKQSYNLIDLDFKLLFPGKETKLFEKWSRKSQQLTSLMAKRIKDATSLDLLSKLSTGNYSKDVCSIVIEVLLHSLFPPTVRKLQRSVNNNVSKAKKPTICDSRNTFIIRADTASDLKSKIKQVTDLYFSNKQKIQPIICTIGNSFFEISEFYVYFENIFYKLDNIIKSLDICFKIFHVLNLEYSIKSKLVWIFIKKYFYEIDLSSTERRISIFAIINDLNKLDS